MLLSPGGRGRVNEVAGTGPDTEEKVFLLEEGGCWRMGSKSSQLGYRRAWHLLNRTGFGASPADIDALSQMPVADAVESLSIWPIADPPAPATQIHRDAASNASVDAKSGADSERGTDAVASGVFRSLANGDVSTLERWWVSQILETADALNEQLVLLWHDHFATSFDKVKSAAMMMQQHALFRRHGQVDGNFASLAHGIVCDPAMLCYLDNDTSIKSHPNENLARELMELFTLGAGHYAEQDVREAARALTGAGVADAGYAFNRDAHDHGEKSILGRTGRWQAGDTVDLLLDEPACADWVSGKLYEHFVADLEVGRADHREQTVLQLARTLRTSSYALAPALKRLLLDELFYDAAVIGRKMKSPIQLVVGTIKNLGTPTRDLGVLTDQLALMGQSLFRPPTVAGWPRGREWIGSASMLARHNTCFYLITGINPRQAITGSERLFGGITAQSARHDPGFLLEGLDSRAPAAVVNWLTDRLLACPCSVADKQPLVAYLNDRGGKVTPDDLLGLLVLITAMPHYQLT